MNETCSCGRPRPRGEFCSVCYPDIAGPIEVAPGVTISPDRLGGKPCLLGTRMTTKQVARMMRDYGRDFIHHGWPHLTDEQIDTACQYEANGA